jgi:predicted amidohydrolase
MTKLNVALMQASSTSCSPEQALTDLGAEMSRAAGLGADVLITPELYLSGYGNLVETAERAQPRASPLLRQAGKLAAQHGLSLVLGYPESTGAGIYNSAVIFDSRGAEVRNYRKINLPNDYERSSFVHGTAAQVFDIAGVRCAVLICYDVEFPELARMTAEMGAELLIVPTALGLKWRIVSDSLIPVRAYENGMFVAYCNFGSDEPVPRFVGLSTICGPDGQVLASAGHAPNLIIATIETDRIREVRSQLNFLPDAARMRAADPIGKR